MASAPSMSVSMECVNVCKLSKGEASWRYDCSVLSCEWKAPRVLTGFLASTPHPPQCSSYAYGRSGRRNLNSRCQIFEVGAYSNYPPKLEFIGKLFRLDFSHCGRKIWQSCCNSRASSVWDDDVSPESLWEFLKPHISYLSPKELDLVYSALKLAFEAHDGQRRRSGEPFILHPVEVARILGELELDWECIAAGLLHDTVEDTHSVSFARIEEEFGAAVRRIVEGETKVSKLGKIKSKNENNVVQDVKADDLHQMFLAMTEEVRVIIVKLADRLHNMRTLSYMPSNKQYSIATETLQIFAPLAKLLGMYQIKSELENLSFMYTNREDYMKLKRRVAALYKEHERELVEANKILKKKIEDDQFLNSMSVKTEVRAVCKEPYSVYKASLKSRNSMNEVNQIAQLRIILQPKTCIGAGPLCNPQQICYHVLGLVHGIWSPVPRAVKDYIATPKPNGYQGLHTTVISFLYESMFRLEVQIRTEEMDLIAERGIAAHYSGRMFVTGQVGHAIPSYNNSGGKNVCLNSTNIALRVSWLNAIREWQEEFVGNMSSREFVDTITRDLLGSRIFVFTPHGEIKNLPTGATVIDYAYMIHTEIGNKMVAAKVNGNLVSPMHVLSNAEVVEIITYNALSSKSAIQRHKQWLQHATTRSARHKIMKFLKEQAMFYAAYIKADTVNDSVTDSEEESEAEELLDIAKPKRPFWEEILSMTDLPFSDRSSQTGIPIESGTILVPMVNGKHKKHVQHVSLKAEELFSVRNGLAKTRCASAQTNQNVLSCLASWQTSKVASWHSLEGHSILWFCVVSVDRQGIVAEVTSALASVGIGICSSVTEIDRGRGMTVMLFHVEASLENLVNACSSVDLILGVLQCSAGCSWPSWSGNPQLLEC